jgi:hypothetical protein
MLSIAEVVGLSGARCLSPTSGGEGGIRTHGTLLRYTRSPGVPIQPALAPLRTVLSTWMTADRRFLRVTW